ncbi:MAG: hypothetical protein K0Q79_921 [Flavipsychrobacter sp.]|jgi:hypothetical protein|nr:hypothetical protein [Flavipsychrobacter sp.]
MNKIILSFICGAAIFFESCSGCKENNPPIDFGGRPLIDTTYTVSPVPTAQVHNVLVEEFTGANCSNCPAAHDYFNSQVITSGGHVNLIALHYYGSIQSKPVAGFTHDFRDSVATQINSTIYNGLLDLPLAGIDRAPVSGVVGLSQPKWAGAMATRLAAPSDMNIEITTGANLVDSLDTIFVKVTYTKLVTVPQSLSVAIVEDSMTDIQEKGLITVDDYEFDNVFRALVTPVPSGSILNLTSKDAGRVFEKAFVYKPRNITPAINQQHCRVIAFVHSPGPPAANYEVFQSMQAPLRP